MLRSSSEATIMEAIADTESQPVALARESTCPRVHPRAGRLCQGCRAAESGANCWEVSISPCCDLPRDSCKQCPVLAAAMRAMSLAQTVRIHMEGDVIVEGEVHIQHPRRLSDTLNDGSHPFIVVTDATVTYPPHTRRPPEHLEMLMVLKSAARLVCPVVAPAA